jgi:hypothetical protein
MAAERPRVSREGWEPDWPRLYPSLERFSGDVGLAADKLVRSYLIEREFHHAILAEPSYERRREMYDEGGQPPSSGPPGM